MKNQKTLKMNSNLQRRDLQKQEKNQIELKKKVKLIKALMNKEMNKTKELSITIKIIKIKILKVKILLVKLKRQKIIFKLSMN